MEAMLRVYNEPATRARSLARWLNRNPDRAELVLKAPEDAANLFGEGFHEASQEAAVALPRKRDG